MSALVKQKIKSRQVWASGVRMAERLEADERKHVGLAEFFRTKLPFDGYPTQMGPHIVAGIGEGGGR